VIASELQRNYQRAVELRASADRVRCAAPDAIEALVLGNASEQERLSTLDHVMACPQCQKEFELLRAIKAAGARRTNVSVRWYALAAVALMAVALTLISVNRNGPTIRGSDAPAVVPIALSPTGVVDVSTARRVVWRAFPNAAQYRVEVLEPSGRLRAAGSVVDTTWMLPDSVAIQSGEQLQWTVEAILPDARRVQSPVVNFRVR
jgi:hypothetical protein